MLQPILVHGVSINTIQSYSEKAKPNTVGTRYELDEFLWTIYGYSTVKEEIFVAKDLHIPLVGFPAINAVNLVEKVCDMTVSKQTVLTRFPQLFSGLK